MQQNIKNNVEITYHGKVLPIKNEKTLIAMQKIDELSKVIHKMDSNQMEVMEDSGESTKLSKFRYKERSNKIRLLYRAFLTL